jgi:alanyl-tRNA synthetase
VLHVGDVAGKLSVGDAATSKVDYGRRGTIMPNHTFTHVLNYALRSVLGDHVDQKGSIVMVDKLRFDFSNNGPVETGALEKIETIVREQLAKDLKVCLCAAAL